MPEETDNTRVQELNGESTIEITKTVVEKTHYSEADLLRELDYFTQLKTKADAGLERVNRLLMQIQNAKEQNQ